MQLPRFTGPALTVAGGQFGRGSVITGIMIRLARISVAAGGHAGERGSQCSGGVGRGP
jgi:hypothetical protein